MGFADELRNLPKKQDDQARQDWETIKNLFVDYIKNNCSYYARCGENSASVYLSDFIMYIEDEYTEKDIEGNAICDIAFIGGETAYLWSRIRNNFFSFMSDDYYPRKGNYPNMLGMTKVLAEKFAEDVKKVLCSEGLEVAIRMHKEFQKVEIAEKYVEHKSSFERLLTGSNGHYEKTEKLKDEMYSFDLRISW